MEMAVTDESGSVKQGRDSAKHSEYAPHVSDAHQIVGAYGVSDLITNIHDRVQVPPSSKKKKENEVNHTDASLLPSAIQREVGKCVLFAYPGHHVRY